MQKNLSDKILCEVLGVELEDSDIINTKMQEAYKIIRSWQKEDEKQEIRQQKVKLHKAAHRRDKNNTWRKVFISLGGMAAVLCLTFTFYVMNPVMAREIPILGSIFAKAADVFPFGKLPEEESEALHDAVDSLYRVADGEITVSLEQEYVSNQALFIGIRIESKQPVPELAVLQDAGGQFLTLRTEENYSFRAEDPITTRRMIEGKFEDEHTFIGIMRIDFSELSSDTRRYDLAVDEADAKGEEYPEYTDEWIDSYEIPSSFDMGLKITQIIGTLKNPTRPEGMKSEEELAQMSDMEKAQYRNSLPKEWVGFPNRYQHWYQDGEWAFEVPVTQKDGAVRVIEVHEDNGEGIGIERIELSPVEMTLHTVKDTEGSMKVVVFDADGKEVSLAANAGGAYAVGGHDISSLYIYICSWEDWEECYAAYEQSGNGDGYQKLIKECAVFETAVDTGK